MAGKLTYPRVSKNKQNTQLSYELPHRIHTSKVYPIQSPNGSTVILYGYDNGVRIVWRGGRPFKIPQPDSVASRKTNGVENAVISLDSDEEGSTPSKFEDKPEFEDEEEEVDPARPYPVILQSLDLYFGTDVLNLALLPAPVLKADSTSWRAIEPLKQKIVFTAVCADNSLRFVTLPLVPPSPVSKARPEFSAVFADSHTGNEKWGETVVLLSGHQMPADGVSMTADFGGNFKDLMKVESRPAPTDLNIIISSHSKEVTGLLLLFRIPIKSPQAHVEPFQTIYLSSPAKSISFNPALSTQSSCHLLVAESSGVCRIYDYRPLSTSTEEESLAGEQGTWRISLYAGFQNTSGESQYTGAHAGFGRKTIVDAQWVSGGRAIVILLNDGEWAVWDIEGVGPGASQGLLGPQGIRGGSRSEYSLTGYIESATKTRSSGPPQIALSKFAPMTPGTRKSAEPFSSRRLNRPVRGQISVAEVPSSSPTGTPEESIVFWLGDNFVVIPSLAKYWAANVHKRGGAPNTLFTGPTSARMIKIEGIDLQGERCSGITQITKASSNGDFPSEILIVGEHRFTILSAVKQAKTMPAQTEARLTLTEKSHNNGWDLDVMGIDQALSRMGNSNGSKRKLF